MVINNVRIFPNPRANESTLKATATMLLNNELLVQSIRIVGKNPSEDGTTELQVFYPVQRLESGRYRHCFFPRTEESRKKYESAILSAYEKVMAGDVPNNTVVFDESEGRPDFEITKATIFSSAITESTRAKVGLELDHEICLRGLFLTVRDDGALFLRMPRRKTTNDHWLDLFHPVDQDARNKLTSAVIPHYESAGIEAAG